MIDNRLCLPCKFPYTRAAYINDNSAYIATNRRESRRMLPQPCSRKRSSRGENHFANALDGACNVRFASAKVHQSICPAEGTIRFADLRPARSISSRSSASIKSSERQSWKLGILVAAVSPPQVENRDSGIAERSFRERIKEASPPARSLMDHHPTAPRCLHPPSARENREPHCTPRRCVCKFARDKR